MKKTIEILKKFFIVVFIVGISIAICMRSELNPISKRVPTVDSDVYVYIGQELKNGKTIYSDIFDHKGPLFHLIELIGIAMSWQGYIGLWIIELIAMITTVSFLYRTSKLLTENRAVALLVVFISVVPLTNFFINGNYPEEYSLPFISIALYYFIKILLNGDSVKKVEPIVLGITLSCVCLIKINLISVWIVYLIALIYKFIKDKKLQKLKELSIYFIIGAVVPVIIAVVVMLIQRNLLDCIKEYILFNFKYATDKTGDLQKTLKTFVTTTYMISIGSCILDFIYKLIKKDKKHIILPICATLYLLLSLIIIVMPKNQYKHYGMILITTYVVPISLILKDSIDLLKPSKNIFGLCLMLIVLPYITLNITRRDIVEHKKDLILLNNERFAFRKTDLTEYIKEITDKDDKILVLGNECNIYLMSERESNCKYIYQIPIVNIDANIMKETIQEIDTKKPKLIVLKLTEYTTVQEYFYKYLEETQAYEMKKEFGKYIVYTKK